MWGAWRNADHRSRWNDKPDRQCWRNIGRSACREHPTDHCDTIAPNGPNIWIRGGAGYHQHAWSGYHRFQSRLCDTTPAASKLCRCQPRRHPIHARPFLQRLQSCNQCDPRCCSVFHGVKPYHNRSSCAGAKLFGNIAGCDNLTCFDAVFLGV
jgi:hypothetical protein